MDQIEGSTRFDGYPDLARVDVEILPQLFGQRLGVMRADTGDDIYVPGHTNVPVHGAGSRSADHVANLKAVKPLQKTREGLGRRKGHGVAPFSGSHP